MLKPAAYPAQGFLAYAEVRSYGAERRTPENVRCLREQFLVAFRGGFELGVHIALFQADVIFFIGDAYQPFNFAVLMFGLFSAISVQKAVRDQLEGIPVTNLYYGLAWFATLLSIVLLTVGLWNADLTKSEKGFYAMAFVLSMYSAIAVQKNTRDMKAVEKDEDAG